jgi:pimeloyl-ACP methyl ester carboxylesterase
VQDSTVNGLRLSYRLSGPDGPPIVLIHGLGGSADATYASVIRHLEDEFRVLAFDNRGVGGSDKPDANYTLEEFARDTYELMRALGIEQAHIVGHSAGGMIAQQFVLDYPDAALSLVVADAPGEMTEASRANFEQRAATVEQGGTAAIVDGVIKNGIGVQAKERYPELVERFRTSLLASPAQPYAATCRALTHLDHLARLAAFEWPVLVLRGDQDGGVPREAAEKLAAAFPNARFVEIPESGHNTPFENPEVFARLVRDFVHQTAGAARR